MTLLLSDTVFAVCRGGHTLTVEGGPEGNHRPGGSWMNNDKRYSPA